MSSKERWRVADKERFKKRQREKKKALHEKQIRKSSKEVRQYIRRLIRPYYEAFRNSTDKHLLFVLKDTQNMEKILFQRIDLGKGYTMLTLPILTEQMVDEYLASCSNHEDSGDQVVRLEDAAIKGLALNMFSVVCDEVKDSPKTIIFRNCRLVGNREDLVTLNVRPYNQNTWYTADTTTIDGYRVFRGKKLQTFFQISGNLGKTCVFSDSLYEILRYRACVGKLNEQLLLDDISELSRRQAWGAGWQGLYLVLRTDDKELARRFRNEQRETAQLNE